MSTKSVSSCSYKQNPPPELKINKSISSTDTAFRMIEHDATPFIYNIYNFFPLPESLKHRYQLHSEHYSPFCRELLNEQGRSTNRKTLFAEGILWILMCIVANAAFQPSIFYLPQQIPILVKILIRQINILPFFIVLTIIEYCRMNEVQKVYMKSALKDLKVKFILSGISYTIALLLSVLPGQYTTLTHLQLFLSCTGFFTIAARCCMRSYVNISSVLGVCVGMAGGLLTMLESDTLYSRPLPTESILFGNGLALIGAGFQTWFAFNTYLIMKKGFPPSVLGLYCNSAAIFVLIPIAMWREDMQFNTEPPYGLFCFLYSHDSFIYSFVILGFLGMLASWTYMKCLTVMKPLILAACMLFMFIVTGMFSSVLSINAFPGFWLWFGGIIMASGLLLNMVGEFKEYETRLTADRYVKLFEDQDEQI